MVKNGNRYHNLIQRKESKGRGEKSIFGEGECEIGAISTTNRLGNLTYVLLSTMGLRGAVCLSGEATECQDAELVQYRANLISISCGYPGYTCPASGNLRSFTRQSSTLSGLWYHSFLDCIEAG